MRIQPLRNRRLLVIASASIFICLVVASAWSSETPGQDKKPFRVVNKTQGVEITKIEVVGKSLHLSFKNISGKKITAYVFGFENDDTITSVSQDDIFGGGGIAAGETHSYSQSIPQPYSPYPRSGDIQFVVMGVVFEDHSTDGDLAAIRPIEDSRAGTRWFLTQAQPLIRDAINLEGAENLAPLAPLRQRIAALQPSANTDMSEGFLQSFNMARERMTRELDELNQQSAHRNLREALVAQEKSNGELLFRLQPR